MVSIDNNSNNGSPSDNNEQNNTTGNKTNESKTNKNSNSDDKEHQHVPDQTVNLISRRILAKKGQAPQ